MENVTSHTPHSLKFFLPPSIAALSLPSSFNMHTCMVDLFCQRFLHAISLSVKISKEIRPAAKTTQISSFECFEGIVSC